jgi:hypothetical protein
MKINIPILVLFCIAANSCIVQFLPEVENYKNYLVVEGLLTDQNSSYKVKISRSSPLNSKKLTSPVRGCLVYITDNIGNKYALKEKIVGVYQSDSLAFRGVAGRKYVLHISSGIYTYESIPMEMKPVPPIDSVYAEVVYNNSYMIGQVVPGYQVYVDTHDPGKKCNFYRWDFTETWEFRLPYQYETILNRICWKTAYSKNIYVKNTSAFKEDRVSGLPLNFITTETDRLKVKYSISVRQFSLNQEEYNYWDKLQRITEDVGGLYDVVPMSVESNIYCTDNPEEKVLGFFSVSSVSTKRLFIKNSFTDFPDFYRKCPVDTVPVSMTIPNLNVFTFIIARLNDLPPTFGTFYVLTDKKECADCSISGSKIMPPFWNETKNDAVIKSAFK